MSVYRSPLRDRLACWLANASLKIATREYRAFVTLHHTQGKRAIEAQLGLTEPVTFGVEGVDNPPAIK